MCAGAMGNSMLRPDGDTVFRAYVHIKEESLYNVQDIRYKTLMGEDSEGVCVSWEEGKECFFLLTLLAFSDRHLELLIHKYLHRTTVHYYRAVQTTKSKAVKLKMQPNLLSTSVCHIHMHQWHTTGIATLSLLAEQREQIPLKRQ